MRSFIALAMPPAVKEAGAGLISQLKPTGAPVKWVRPELIHITLKFLGELDQAQIPALDAGLALALAGQAAPRLKLFGCGAFPSLKRPQVVWLGISGQVEAVAGLAKAAEEAASGLGFPPEDRAFKPHLTIGRVKRGRGGKKTSPPGSLIELGQALAQRAAWPGPEFVANEAALMKSTLTPAGPIYEPIKKYQLSGN